MNFKEQFYNLLDQFSSSPFLFLGSGFSHRYLNTDNWEDLLTHFSNNINIPFEKYRSKAAGNWPKVGSYLSEDYHSAWFNSDDFKEQREKYKQEMVDIASPLKVLISVLLEQVSSKVISPEFVEEIEALKKAKIDGIITTNYDLLCERLFPEFSVYKSQRELIFSTIQEVGELYKIHGCCTEPNSIVITTEDYKSFDDNNAYLAAKLLTVFLEHPTIFIGYSLSDTNVRTILKSVIKCLDQTQINELSKRLFFIQYNNTIGGDPTLEKYDLEIGGVILPLTRINASSYLQIYEVLASLNQKFSVSLFRKIKEHIYELVLTNDPAGKISVVNYDDTTDLNNIDVVIGFGPQKDRGEKSYETFTRFDVANDVLDNGTKFDNNELCHKTLPKIVKGVSWIPVCKYVSRIVNKDNLDNKLLNAFNRPYSDWKISNTYLYKRKAVNDSYKSINELVQNNKPIASLNLILLLDLEKIDVDQLKIFLLKNRNLLNDSATTSPYMKLLSLYDRLLYNPTFL